MLHGLLYSIELRHSDHIKLNFASVASKYCKSMGIILIDILSEKISREQDSDTPPGGDITLTGEGDRRKI